MHEAMTRDIDHKLVCAAGDILMRHVNAPEQAIYAAAREMLAALPQRMAVPEPPAEVSIKPMKLSDGRVDHFVSFRCGKREVTPHVFRDQFKAEYHVALYRWVFGQGDKPDLMAFDEDEWPAREYTAEEQQAFAALHQPAKAEGSPYQRGIKAIGNRAALAFNTVRVCPKRDATCRHGMGCPYVDGYRCNEPTRAATGCANG